MALVNYYYFHADAISPNNFTADKKLLKTYKCIPL